MTSGRDARFIQDQGYHVECSDAARSFVDKLVENFYARQINIITDDVDTSYDIVIANAVLYHFTFIELRHAIHKIFNSLHNGGKFACTVRLGSGESWSRRVGLPMYNRYWQREEIVHVFADEGYVNIETITETFNKSSGNGQDNTWMGIIAYKHTSRKKPHEPFWVRQQRDFLKPMIPKEVSLCPEMNIRDYLMLTKNTSL